MFIEFIHLLCLGFMLIGYFLYYLGGVYFLLYLFISLYLYLPTN